MGILSYQTALQTVQNALMDVIRVAMSYRLAVADLAALVAVNTAGLRNKQVAFPASVGNVFMLDKSSTATPNGSTILAPIDVGSGPGRWLSQGYGDILDPFGVPIAQVATGYVKRVMLWSGEFSEEVWKNRILNQRPGVVLQFSGETKDIESNQRGNFTRKQYHFSVWGVSQNLRPDLEAETGSPIAADSNDPGVVRIMGDLEYLLDGLTGYEIGTDGLDFMMMDAAQPGVEDYDGREYIWTAPLDVRITAGKCNVTTTEVTDMYVQFQQVEQNGQAVADPTNYVSSGLTVAVGAGFTAAPANGVAILNGNTVTVHSADAHVYTPQRTTYRDLNPDSTFTYIETYSDDMVPPVTEGALRIALTITDWTGIIEDRFIAMTVNNIGPNNHIEMV